MRFCDIPGHQAARRQLTLLADSDRIPHALLISGPAGIGKLALARAFAQYIHCTCRTPEGDSCGVCPACRQHASCNNADMYYVFPVLRRDGLRICDDYMDKWRAFLDGRKYTSFDAWLGALDAGNSQPTIYADEAAEIIRKLSLSNYSARYKIMLIWLPEKMQEAAANKLLKIIEEPWEDTRFILVSDEPQNILPTVFSRTQRVNLKRPDRALMAEVISSERGLEPSDAATVARLAEGNIATALELTAAGGEAEEFGELFRSVMRQAYSRDMRALKDSADAIAAFGREKTRRLLTYFSRQIRENFISNYGIAELNVLTPDEAAFSRNFARFITSSNAPGILKTFDDAASDIARNANAKMVLLDSFINVIRLLRLQ